MAKIVMYWNCHWCSTKKIPGYDRICPGCSHPRSRNVKFYHSNPPHEATPTEIIKMGKPDPNWYCEGCNCGNIKGDKKCWQCGAPRTAKSAVQAVPVAYHSKDLAFSEEDALENEKRIPMQPKEEFVPDDDPYNPQPRHAATPVATPYRTSRSYQTSNATSRSETTESTSRNVNLQTAGIIGGGAIALILAVVLVWTLFFKTHTETIQVTALNWTQSCRIEEYQTFHEAGWSVPGAVPNMSSAGRQTSVVDKKSGDKKVTDGYHNEERPDTCYDTRTVPDTCTGTRSVPDTCYRDDGNGGSESYSCSTTETYTYACTTTESYSYSCTKTVSVEDYHYEDIIDPWYEYDIDRWTTIGTYPTSGTGLEPYYDPVQPIGEKQRKIEDGGKYCIGLSPVDENSKVKPFENCYDFATYKSFFVGQTFEVQVNRYGTIINK